MHAHPPRKLQFDFFSCRSNSHSCLQAVGSVREVRGSPGLAVSWGSAPADQPSDLGPALLETPSVRFRPLPQPLSLAAFLLFSEGHTQPHQQLLLGSRPEVSELFLKGPERDTSRFCGSGAKGGSYVGHSMTI